MRLALGFAFASCAVGAVACGAAAPAPALALSNSGAGPAVAPAPNHANNLHGRVLDVRAGEPAIGVTVVATSPTLQGEQVVITDENGEFVIDVPPGTYTLTYYYNDTTTMQEAVIVQANRRTNTVHRIDLTPRPAQAPIRITVH